jgi:hypothetical protein
MPGLTCQSQEQLKWRPVAGPECTPAAQAHAPVARALPRTSTTCVVLCALTHCAWLQWRISLSLWLLLAPSHRPHSSTADARLAIADHRLAASDHWRAPLTPPQRQPVSWPSFRATSCRPPPSDAAPHRRSPSAESRPVDTALWWASSFASDRIDFPTSPSISPTHGPTSPRRRSPESVPPSSAAELPCFGLGPKGPVGWAGKAVAKWACPIPTVPFHVFH